MLIDRARIAIRVRDHLDLFDLAVAMCRSRPLPILLASMAGILPCAAFDAMLLTADFDTSYLFITLLIIQAPWATSVLTLYLGQSTFEPRVSFRRLLRDWFGSLPQMLLYQGALRTVCAMFFPAWLYIALRMKYLNEVILLERSSIRGTASRAAKFHRAISSQILRELTSDGIVFLAIVVLGARGLGQLADMLWSGVGIVPDFSEEEWFWTWLLGPAFQWTGLATFWATMAFFAVVRFLTYLDVRIRREGWDVELKIRAQAKRIEEGDLRR